ncbi:MAG: 50S ribosomal protein L21 [Anaerosomatales bacterium]|nr:50S ribosomal protein L21 [Anaerosomatales bacterium]MDT8433548.1 50S ribosomal protein L21 [Anaerosomatales bacterium]
MYAVVLTGGKQLKVEKGTEAVIERLAAEVGETVTFDVLFVSDGEDIVVDSDALASATVTAEILEHFRGDKQVVFKFKKRKGYKRLKGHRQEQTRVRVTDVALGTGKPAARKAAKAEAPAPAAEKKVETPAVDEVVAVVESAAAQCEAVKSNGERCANKAKEGSKYCGVHAKKYEG